MIFGGTGIAKGFDIGVVAKQENYHWSFLFCGELPKLPISAAKKTGSFLGKTRGALGPDLIPVGPGFGPGAGGAEFHGL